MCVANLNVTTQPCSHRWYRLVRSCSDNANLTNCPERLKLEGWETKNQDCPWCSPPGSPTEDVQDSTHKLFGGPSPIGLRRCSDATTGSNSPFRGRNNSASTCSTRASRSSSPESDDETREMERAERNRMMNRRLESYITMNPAKVLTGSSVDELPAVNEHPSDNISPLRSDSVMGRSWKRGVKLSRNMFKG